MSNLGNAWHIPGSPEVDGLAGMRDPIGPVIGGTRVRVVSGNQFQGDGGDPGDQKGAKSFVRYRIVGDRNNPTGRWKKRKLKFLRTVGNNIYHSAAMRTRVPRARAALADRRCGPGSQIQYYLKISYRDRHDDTFLYKRGDTSARTRDEAEAQNEPFLIDIDSPKWPLGRARALFYLIVGLLTGTVATIDTLTAANVTSRTGAFLLAIAAGSAIWAGCLLWQRTPSKWSGIGGAVAVTAIAIVYAKHAWSDRPVDCRPLVAMSGAIIIAALALAAGIYSWRKDPSASPTRPKGKAAIGVEIVLAALGLIGALLAAALQVGGGWYTSTHSATQLHPDLTIRIAIGAPAIMVDASASVPVEIVIKNGGQSPLDLPMTHYTAIGFRIASPTAMREIGPSAWAALSGADPFAFTNAASKFTSQECATVLQFGRVVEAMTNLGPGEEKARRLVVPLPGGDRNAFDGIQIQVEAAGILDDDLRTPNDVPTFYTSSGSILNDALDASALYQNMGSGGGYAQWDIERSTLLSKLISAERQIRVGWRILPVSNPGIVCTTPSEFDTQTVRPYVHFVHAADDKKDNWAEGIADDKKILQDWYDPFYVYAAAERLLAEKDEPGASHSASASGDGR